MLCPGQPALNDGEEGTGSSVMLLMTSWKQWSEGQTAGKQEWRGAELLANVFHIWGMQMLTLLLQALPSSICTGTKCFSGIVEAFWAEQKAPRTWWPRLKAALRVCSSEQAQPEHSFHWVRLGEGKKNVNHKNLIWWPGESRGSELPEQNQIDSGLKNFWARLRVEYHRSTARLHGADWLINWLVL